MKYENMVNLVVGDWSGDGHSMTETITISSNLDRKAIELAYKNGSEKLEIDFTEESCYDYEDTIVTLDVWEKFTNVGLKLEDIFIDDEEELKEAIKSFRLEKEFNIDIEKFVKLYLFVVKQGNSSFEYEIEENDSPNINIGGYGLFF